MACGPEYHTFTYRRTGNITLLFAHRGRYKRSGYQFSPCRRWVTAAFPSLNQRRIFNLSPGGLVATASRRQRLRSRWRSWAPGGTNHRSPQR